MLKLSSSFVIFSSWSLYLFTPRQKRKKRQLIIAPIMVIRVIISTLLTNKETGVCLCGRVEVAVGACSLLFAPLVISQTRYKSPSMICPLVCVSSLWVSHCSSVPCVYTLYVHFVCVPMSACVHKIFFYLYLDFLCLSPAEVSRACVYPYGVWVRVLH